MILLKKSKESEKNMDEELDEKSKKIRDNDKKEKNNDTIKKENPENDANKTKEGHKEDKQNNDKKKSTNLLFKTLGLIIIVGVFALFFMLSQSHNQPQVQINQTFHPESYRYNGFLFQKGMYAWYSKIKVGDLIYDVSFVYGPKEVENIPVFGKVNDLILKANKLYITTEPDYPSRVGKAQVEISKITSPRTSNFGMLNIPTINTVTYIPEELKNRYNYPEITCKNATLNQTVIYLKIGNKTQIYNDSFCVIVEGLNDTEVVKAADRLVYNLLGIIK